jgi:hypothetical protein
LPLQAFSVTCPVIQLQLAAHGIQAGGVVVIFLRLHIGAALNGLLHQLLEVQPFGAGIAICICASLPVTTEIVGVNARSGKFAAQRQLTGQV